MMTHLFRQYNIYDLTDIGDENIAKLHNYVDKIFSKLVCKVHNEPNATYYFNDDPIIKINNIIFRIFVKDRIWTIISSHCESYADCREFIRQIINKYTDINADKYQIKIIELDDI